MQSRKDKYARSPVSIPPLTDNVGLAGLDISNRAGPSLSANHRVAQELQGEGRGGDTILAHINPAEAKLLKSAGGSGAINPKTGLREFDRSAEGDDGPGGPDNDQGGPEGHDGGGDGGDGGDWGDIVGAALDAAYGPAPDPNAGQGKGYDFGFNFAGLPGGPPGNINGKLQMQDKYGKGIFNEQGTPIASGMSIDRMGVDADGNPVGLTGHPQDKYGDLSAFTDPGFMMDKFDWEDDEEEALTDKQQKALKSFFANEQLSVDEINQSLLTGRPTAVDTMDDAYGSLDDFEAATEEANESDYGFGDFAWDAFSFLSAPVPALSLANIMGRFVTDENETFATAAIGKVADELGLDEAWDSVTNFGDEVYDATVGQLEDTTMGTALASLAKSAEDTLDEGLDTLDENVMDPSIAFLDRNLMDPFSRNVIDPVGNYATELAEATGITDAVDSIGDFDLAEALGLGDISLENTTLTGGASDDTFGVEGGDPVANALNSLAASATMNDSGGSETYPYDPDAYLDYFGIGKKRRPTSGVSLYGTYLPDEYKGIA
jgi:hypothetical protein